MRVLHAVQPFKGVLTLPPFGTVIIFQPNEMPQVELVIETLLKLDLTDESRASLEQVLERVHSPQAGEIN